MSAGHPQTNPKIPKVSCCEVLGIPGDRHFSSITYFLCAGLFGIGGGVVLGPLLLSFGTHAKIAAATSNLMVLFSSAAAAIVYGLAGDLNLQISLIFGTSCAVGHGFSKSYTIAQHCQASYHCR